MAELIREIVIDATPETIWPFLTEADKHVEWIGTVAEIDPRPGGIYRVLVGGQHQSAGEYIEVVPNEKVVLTFGWEEQDHPIPPGSTTLEITLHPEGDKTRVRLVHRGLPADAVEDHGKGWTHYLERLSIATTGGVAGPDTVAVIDNAYASRSAQPTHTTASRANVPDDRNQCWTRTLIGVRHEQPPDRVAGGVGSCAPATARKREGVDPLP